MTGISKLKKLARLKEFYIDKYFPLDFYPLSKLINLVKLFLSENNRNLEPISNLANLKTKNMYDKREPFIRY